MSDSDHASAPAEQPTRRKSNKNLIIVLCSLFGAAALILLIIFVLIPALSGVDWEKSRIALEEMQTSSRLTEYGSVCYNMANDSNNEDVPMEEFSELVNACTEEIKKYDSAITNFGNSSVVAYDEDIKAMFSNIKDAYDHIKDGLSNFPSTMSTMHQYAINTENFDQEKADATEIDKMVLPLLESSNQVLRDYGERFSSLAKTLLNAAKEYNEKRQVWYDTPSSATNFKDIEDAYHQARDTYYDVYDEFDELTDNFDAEAAIGLSDEDMNSLENAIEELYEVFIDKYTAATINK